MNDELLRSYVLSLCLTKSSFMNYEFPYKFYSLVNWPEGSYRSGRFANVSIVVDPNDSNKVKLLILKNVDFTHGWKNLSGPGHNIRNSWSTPLDKAQWAMVFRFNSYYKYMVCGDDCTLSSILKFVRADTWTDQFYQLGTSNDTDETWGELKKGDRPIVCFDSSLYFFQE